MKNPTTTPTAQAGFALPATVLALLVVGILVTGGFFAAQQEQKIGLATQNAQEAFYMAERGISEVIENWDPATYSALTPFDTVPAVYADTIDGGRYRVEVTRMSNFAYYVESEGVSVRGAAEGQRRVAQILKIRTADIDPPAALTTYGSLKYGGSSEIHGRDQPPNGTGGGSADWTGSSVCDGVALEDKPGLLIDDTTSIDWNGNRRKIEGNMSGEPKFDEDPTILPDSLLTFGDLDWEDLTSLADIRTTSSVSPRPSLNGDGTCNRTDRTNWGDPMDPAAPCFGYFPIVHIDNPGSQVILNGGYGQGILLVEGDLKVNGGFEWYGPVYVRGQFWTNGSGGHFWGGVTAANVNLSQTTVLGNAEIQYSSCAVQRAILNASGLTQTRPLFARSWVDVSAIGDG